MNGNIRGENLHSNKKTRRLLKNIKNTDTSYHDVYVNNLWRYALKNRNKKGI